MRPEDPAERAAPRPDCPGAAQRGQAVRDPHAGLYGPEQPQPDEQALHRGYKLAVEAPKGRADPRAGAGNPALRGALRTGGAAPDEARIKRWRGGYGKCSNHAIGFAGAWR